MVSSFCRKVTCLVLGGNYSFFDLFLLLRFWVSKHKRYVYHKKKNSKWAYISYLPEPYYRSKDKLFLSAHQNRRESIVIGEVLAELGYNYVVEQFNSGFCDNNGGYDLVFGHEPNFVKMAQRNPRAIKIYYSTGANWSYQNEIIKRRTKEFSYSHHLKALEHRLVTPHTGYDMADYILQIGTGYTLETFPDKYRKKITLINQSSNLIKNPSLDIKLASIKLNNYLWIGGGGSILKGIDLVIDYFVKNEDLVLHIIGNIDSDINEYYSGVLKKSKNILVHGFLDINSDKFAHIAYQSAFNIYPSGSEGGVPGSVIAAMKFGVIPLTFRYSSPNDIDVLGYQIRSLDNAGIKEAIDWTCNLSYSFVCLLVEKNMAYSAEKWTLESYKSEFKNFIIKYTK